MPRTPKPHLHRGWYVSNVGGERHEPCRESEGKKAAVNGLGKVVKGGSP
jgi:hypothetical protein